MFRDHGDSIIRRLSSWRREPLGPVLLLAAVAGIFFFLKLGSEVQEQEFRHFDEGLLLVMRNPADSSDPAGPRQMEEVARDLTALGSFTVLTLVTLIGLSAALIAGRRKQAFSALFSVLAAMPVMNLLKSGYNRPRPELVAHAVFVNDASFPSGHSTMAAVVYLTLGIMIARAQSRRRVRIFVMALAVAVTVLVGLSRVYLGVHWPTDVIAGWALGTVWAVLFWLWVRRIESRS